MNRIFIFERLEEVSDNYHCGGGLVVIAKDLDTAKLIVGQNKSIVIDDWDKAVTGDTTLEQNVYIFPDAGCC